jgi:hypothetical protein
MMVSKLATIETKQTSNSCSPSKQRPESSEPMRLATSTSLYLGDDWAHEKQAQLKECITGAVLMVH